MCIKIIRTFSVFINKTELCIIIVYRCDFDLIYSFYRTKKMNVNALSLRPNDESFFFHFEYIFWFLIYHWPLCRVISGWKHTRKSSAINVQCSINIKRDMWYSHPNLSCFWFYFSMSPVSFLLIHSFIELFLSAMPDSSLMWFPVTVIC